MHGLAVRGVGAGLAAVLAVGWSSSGAVGTAPAQTSRELGLQVLATEFTPTALRAYGGRVVWSSFDPDTRRYRLMTWARGRVAHVPVRSRKVPFDADLGPGRSGGIDVVYSRCAREPAQPDRSFLPEYPTGKGCRLWRYTFGDDRERRVPRPRGASSSEVMPSVWGSRVAFISRRRTSGRRRLSISVRSLTREVADSRVRIPSTVMARGAGSIDLGDIDLRRDRVLSTWSYVETWCRRELLPDDKTLPDGSELFGGTARHQRVLVRACGADPVKAVFSPSWSGSEAHVLVDTFTRRGSSLRQRAYAGDGSVAEDGAAPDRAAIYAPSANADYYVLYFPASSTDSGQDEFRIARRATER